MNCLVCNFPSLSLFPQDKFYHIKEMLNQRDWTSLKTFSIAKVQPDYWTTWDIHQQYSAHLMTHSPTSDFLVSFRSFSLFICFWGSVHLAKFYHSFKKMHISLYIDTEVEYVCIYMYVHIYAYTHTDTSMVLILLLWLACSFVFSIVALPYSYDLYIKELIRCLSHMLQTFSPVSVCLFFLFMSIFYLRFKKIFLT